MHEKAEIPFDRRVQQRAIKHVYDIAAPLYDSWASETGPTKYTLLRITKELFEKYRVTNGNLLDVGVGTGPLKDVLGNSFDYTGIDLSNEALKRAQQKGYKTTEGSLEEIVPAIQTGTYDHTIALSCLYYIHPEQIVEVLDNLYRISSKSLLVSLDAVGPIQEVVLQKTGARLFDYSKREWPHLPQPSEDILTQAWTSPSAGIRVDARILFWLK